MGSLTGSYFKPPARFCADYARRLLVIILIAVVPILAFILCQAKIARDVQIAEAREAAWQIVENVALRESRFIDAAQQLLTLLAETPEVAGGDKSACSHFLRRFAEHNTVYVDLGVADANGDVACRSQLAEFKQREYRRSPAIFAKRSKRSLSPSAIIRFRAVCPGEASISAIRSWMTMGV